MKAYQKIYSTTLKGKFTGIKVLTDTNSNINVNSLFEMTILMTEKNHTENIILNTVF